MKTPKIRALAVAGAIAALFPLIVAAPATAAPAPGACQVLVAGPTPAAEVDLDGDGNPEARVPSVRDVTLCVGADVVLTETPTVDREQCGGFGSCMAFHVSVGLTGYASTAVSFCYTVDGREVCGMTDLPVLTLATETRRMCVGYDLRGGFPCSGGQLIAFE